MKTIFQNCGLLLYRILSAGLLFYLHGLPKIENYSYVKRSFPDPIGLGSWPSLVATLALEVVGAGLIVLGIGTRAIAAIMTLFFLIIIFIIHGSDPLLRRETAILYGLIFLGLYISGGGQYSLGALLPRLKRWN